MLKFVKQSVSTMVDGSRVRLTKDDPWRDDDPVVRAVPHFFVDEPSKVQTSIAKFSDRSEVVEAATANPGERRAAKPRAAAKKKAASS